MICIEGTSFALLIVSDLYLRGRGTGMPVSGPPSLRWGSLNFALLLLSIAPNALAKRAAEHFDLNAVRRWMVVCVALGVAFLGIRGLEFASLNVSWHHNAYGSVLWTLLGFHTVHLLTDFVDTAVLAVVMFTGPLKPSRFVDVSENAMYWYFVVAAWIPIYLTIYWTPLG